MIPSLEASRGPKEKMVVPGYVKGRNTQRNTTNPFTTMRRKKSLLRFNLADISIRMENKAAMDSIPQEELTATTTEKKMAQVIFILGSRL